MTQPTVKVIVTRKLPAPVEARLAELFDTELNSDDAPMTQDQLAAAAARADVLVPTVSDRIDAAVIAAAGPRLRLIAQFGAGTNNIDVAAAAERHILLTNTPGVLTDDTADLAMALILAVPRRLVEGERVMKAGGFKGWSPTWMMGRRIGGKTLGILGMGRIGQAVARRARAFGLDVCYHNRRRVSRQIEDALGARFCPDLDGMLAEVDILSVNCPLTPATHHLIDAGRLARMKPDACIVNTARGEIIDEAALADALEAGKLGGAGLDVFEHEPSVEPRLAAMANVVLAPHLGSATLEARTEMGEKVIINIKTFIDGHQPPDRVIPAML